MSPLTLFSYDDNMFTILIALDHVHQTPGTETIPSARSWVLNWYQNSICSQDLPTQFIPGVRSWSLPEVPPLSDRSIPAVSVIATCLTGSAPVQEMAGVRNGASDAPCMESEQLGKGIWRSYDFWILINCTGIMSRFYVRVLWSVYSFIGGSSCLLAHCLINLSCSRLPLNSRGGP